MIDVMPLYNKILLVDKHKGSGRFCVIFRNCTTNNSITVKYICGVLKPFILLGMYLKCKYVALLLSTISDSYEKMGNFITADLLVCMNQEGKGY